jgi:REP element-mobilizing transposase RayT
MAYDSQKHQRRSIRLPGYDYSLAGAYFVTICTHERECLLGQVEDGAMLLSGYGRIVEQCWRALPHHFPGVELDAFVVMPNHVHGIIMITAPCRGEAFARQKHAMSPGWVANASPLQSRPYGTKTYSLGAMVQNFKSVSSRRINQVRLTPGAPVWQRNYYEHIVRNEDELNSIRQYVLGNPTLWEKDENNPDRL